MKYEFLDKKTVKIFVEREKDLLILYKIINPSDIIEGYDYRVVEINNQKYRKKIWFRIEIEDINFSEYSDSLRISGKILDSSEEVQGHYHTFDVKIGSEFILKKEKGFKNHEILELKKSKKKKTIYIVSLDNNSIALGKIKDDLEIIYEKDFYISKEDPERESKIKKIYSEVINLIGEDSDILIIVGPVFYPEVFSKYFEDKRRDKRIFCFKVSNGGKNGIYEFLNRKEYLSFLKELEICEINEKINDFIVSMTKDKAVFGIENVYKKLEECNLEYILISFKWFKKIKSDKSILQDVLKIFEYCERCKTEIFFVYESNIYFDLIDKFGIVGKVRY